MSAGPPIPDDLPEELIAFDPKWLEVLQKVKARFGQKPDLQALLYLIGIQELGQVHHKFSKEQKQDLMHIAVCKLLSTDGYYNYIGKDEEGWPHYEPSKSLPSLSIGQQEVLLKKNIIHYFSDL
ncbi:MAG: hypothetical protein ACI959_001270 [Limisphaerales bacterium]|jgi:hypothetical protein